MPMMRKAVAWVGLLLVGACSSAPSGGGQAVQPAGVFDRGMTGAEVRLSETGSVSDATLRISPEAAWQVLPLAYDTLGLGGGVIDAQGRSFGNPSVTGRTLLGSRTDSFFRCANQGTAASSVNRFRIEFSIATTVTGTPDGQARLTTNIAAMGTPWEGTSSGRILCVSKGTLEGAIRDQVAALAAGGG